jgi:hypothetical protein
VLLRSNTKSRNFDAVLGETALVRRMLVERGLPVTEVFVEELLSLPSVAEMQAVLRDKLQPLLPSGYHGAVPALENVQLHGYDEDESQEVQAVPVAGNVVHKNAVFFSEVESVSEDSSFSMEGVHEGTELEFVDGSSDSNVDRQLVEQGIADHLLKQEPRLQHKAVVQ